MRLRHQKPVQEDDLEMSSMIDIVFQLLIFFMVGTSFTVPEKKMVTDLPKAGQARKEVPEEMKDLEMVKIFIRFAEGEAGIDITCNGESLGGNWSALSEKMQALAGLVPDLPVIIDAEPAIPFKHIIRAMDVSKQANLTNIAFSAGSAENAKP